MERLKLLNRWHIAIGVVVIAIVVLLAVQLFSSQQLISGDPPSQAAVVGVKDDSVKQELDKVIDALNSDNPRAQAQAFVPEYQTQLKNKRILPKNTRVTVDYDSFWSIDNYADVEARVGTDHYLLRLVKVNDKWYIFATEKLEDQ